MQRGPLVGVVTDAHREINARLAAVEAAQVHERVEQLARLAQVIHATAEAEEHFLFPALRQAVGDDVLVETCAADHSEAAHRLETIALHPRGPGFEMAISALAKDVRDHMRDELDAVVPVLAEALGEDRSAELADEFRRAVDGEHT
jgi:iron-sulfur cluster repair protein YtfE (RIC family)